MGATQQAEPEPYTAEARARLDAQALAEVALVADLVACRAPFYAVRVLSEAPRECLAVVHTADLTEARTFAASASEDGMRGEVFDVSREPARLVVAFESAKCARCGDVEPVGQSCGCWDGGGQ